MPGEQTQGLACNLSAVTPEQSRRYGAIREQLRERLDHIEELADGYALRFAYDPILFVAAAEFVTFESLCCPFFKLVLERESHDAAMRLCITGPDGSKSFIIEILGQPSE